MRTEVHSLIHLISFIHSQQFDTLKSCLVMCSDKLYEIPRIEWSELRDLYRKNWPKNEIAFNVVQNYIDWTNIEPNLRNFKVYSYDEKWRQHGTYIIIVSIHINTSKKCHFDMFIYKCYVLFC